MERDAEVGQSLIFELVDGMSSSNPHRIDPPSTAVRPMSMRSRGGGGSPAKLLGTAQPDDGVHQSIELNASQNEAASRAQPTDFPSREVLLELHAGELIDRLQSWATDLDAREAQLNARSSLQDHRERRFRLSQQDASTEIAEQQRSIERLRGEIAAQARRLAFQGDSSPHAQENPNPID